MKLYQNALIFENGEFIQKDMLVQAGKIEKIATNLSCNCETFDLTGKKIIPALIDIHTHGANGYDFNLANLSEMRKIIDFYISHGVGSVFPTVMTDEDEVMKRQLNLVYQLSKEYPQVKGIHLEGPFLSKEYRGAMPEHLLQEASYEKFLEYYQASGEFIKIITVSPEVPGAIDFIKTASQKGLIVSLGHSGADYATAMKAVAAGAKSFTHTLNAMRQLTQHGANIAGAAFLSDNYIEVICDGKHVQPEVVQFLLKVKGLDRFIGVTDSMMAAGLGDGKFRLGVNNVTVIDGDAKITETGTRAGSTLIADDCLKNFMKFTGLPLTSALKIMTENPAKLLNIYNITGSLEEGKLAEFLIID
ncbi:MAG: N-acetylglucosamine-6-phosphate deacetylase [Bacilli bacterium]|nr:N-acetylglucosamine-6-phosphate deacetylase [Bacilli bacterium]